MNLHHPLNVIAITGGKGGVGKTQTAINLSTCLTQHGFNVTLLDADFSLGKANIALGVVVNQNLSHVISGKCLIEDIVINTKFGFDLIPAAHGKTHMANLNILDVDCLFELVLNSLQAKDFLIVDTAAGLSSSVIGVLKNSSNIYLVVSQDPASIADAYAIIKILFTKFKIQEYHIIINMSDKLESFKIFAKLNHVACKFLGVKINFAGFVEYDSFLLDSNIKNHPVVDIYPSSCAAKCFYVIAQHVIAKSKFNPFKYKINLGSLRTLDIEAER